jgi:hypothetical protein
MRALDTYPPVVLGTHHGVEVEWKNNGVQLALFVADLLMKLNVPASVILEGSKNARSWGQEDKQQEWPAD